jgi:pilus assembly protein CpaF
MRELATRLQASLGMGAGADTAEDDLWQRAETTASQLVEQIVADGGLPPGVDTDGLLRDVVAETVGTGPFEDLLANEDVREITVTRHDRVFVDRGGGLELGGRWFSSPDAVSRCVARLLARAGRGEMMKNGSHEGALLQARIEGGLLLTAAMPPLAPRGPTVTIRRPARHLAALTDLVEQGVLSQPMADLLDAALRGRKNVIICGAQGSGRSTLLAAMARQAAEAGERVVVVEETEELDLGDAPWISLIGFPNTPQALWNAVRLKPDRLVVGDVRGAEALDLLAALVGGSDGTLAALQAGSPRDALVRLEAMARLAPQAPPPAVLRDELSRGVHLIVHMARTADGPRVVEIAEVQPGGETTPVYAFRADAGGGRFNPTGHMPSWAEGAQAGLRA